MKNILYWLIAFLITAGAAFYQRTTGPTYPLKTEITIHGTSYKLKLKRSQTNTRPCNINLSVPGDVQGTIFYKRYPSDDPWTKTEMQRTGGVLTGILPSQPAAGKLQYYAMLTDETGTEISVQKENPVTIRFKGNVPAFIMIPHILIMFIAMLLSSLAGLFAAFGNPRHKRYGLLTLIFLLAGGIVLGPLVQYHAFGELWTGVPFGWDLTDNKTLVAITFWILAVILNRKKDRPVWTVVAAVVLLIIYSIPHSLFGSQLDYSSGVVTQGIITFFLPL